MKLLTSVKWEAENDEEGVPRGDPSRMEVVDSADSQQGYKERNKLLINLEQKRIH